MRRVLWMVALAASLAACEGGALVADEGEAVEAPFEVSGDAEGLFLVYFDDDGTHVAARRSEIPVERREMVRVDDLRLAPEERGDGEWVFVTDLRRAGPEGTYPVRMVARSEFEEAAARATGRPPGDEAAAEVAAAPTPMGEVIIYGASWCGACRSTAAFLRERGVEFVERDVEREPGARQAMQQAARAAGVQPRGIPVIDFRGRIITGFNRGALEQAIRETRAL